MKVQMSPMLIIGSDEYGTIVSFCEQMTHLLQLSNDNIVDVMKNIAMERSQFRLQDSKTIVSVSVTGEA